MSIDWDGKSGWDVLPVVAGMKHLHVLWGFVLKLNVLQHFVIVC